MCFFLGWKTQSQSKEPSDERIDALKDALLTSTVDIAAKEEENKKLKQQLVRAKIEAERAKVCLFEKFSFVW